MKINLNHSWVKTVAEAKQIQEQLRHKVVTADRLEEVKYVAGIDIGFEDRYRISKAAVAVLSYPQLELVETAIARIPTAFPYVPGYLSFREIPAILAALPQIKQTPDLILCDGQGYAHPRRFGLACHLGVLLDIPTIGVAKSRFIGEHEEIPLEKGSWQPLKDGDETI
ncbi:MAG: deoxyribonuclease V, partial [Cyanobacteria bacterium P01_G01_bin.19]